MGGNVPFFRLSKDKNADINAEKRHCRFFPHITLQFFSVVEFAEKQHRNVIFQSNTTTNCNYNQ
jgi:hypothetical protein